MTLIICGLDKWPALVKANRQRAIARINLMVAVAEPALKGKLYAERFTN